MKPFVRWLSLLLVGALLCGGCAGIDIPLAPCQGDGIGPLTANPDGFKCEYTCECNNQRFYGVCEAGGRCKVLGERYECGRAKEVRELLSSNRFFAQECPTTAAQKQKLCPSGTFDKICQDQELQEQRWGNCRCVGALCRPYEQVCGTNCTAAKPCACIDLQQDPKNCGACGAQCPQGSVCQKGRCLCPKGKTLCQATCKDSSCPAVCADLTSDSAHCGACRTACESGGVCAQSTCQEVLLQAGSLMRGTPDHEIDWDLYVNIIGIPRYREIYHHATITRPFFIGKYEVTRGWFQQLMGYDPSNWPCTDALDKCPVHHVTLYQAMDFLNQLSDAKGLERCYRCVGRERTPNVKCVAKEEFKKTEIYRCLGYRLPTDAEWEYAVRAGTNTVWYTGSPEKLPMDPGEPFPKLLGSIAWNTFNADEKLHGVGLKKPNAWGLYDMFGNVAEWVWDYTPKFNSEDKVDPFGEWHDWEFKYRGGHIFLPPMLMRAGFRGSEEPGLQGSTDPALVNFFGFRIARTFPTYNPNCSRVGLSSCGAAGCKSTRFDASHCGSCARKCPASHICQIGQCVVPEAEVPTRDKDGKPIVWTRGYINTSTVPSDYCQHRDSPPHKAQFSHRFMVDRFEVRQLDFAAMLGFNPSQFAACADCPVDSVSWFMAVAYANALSKHKGLEQCYDCAGEPDKSSLFCTLKLKFRGNSGKDYYKCKGYRLPTEAEWEFAALAGGRRKNLCSIEGWYTRFPEDQSGHSTSPVGSRQPNELGLYDFYGNVREWVWDAYAAYPVTAADQEQGKVFVDPIGILPPPPTTCEQCEAKWDDQKTQCHPCFRGQRGGTYAVHDISRKEATVRSYMHVTKIRFLPNGARETPSVVGFRLVRTIDESK